MTRSTHNKYSLQDSRIILATNNDGKIREYASLFKPYQITVISSQQIKLTSPPETELTLEGNARLKANYAMKMTGLIALAEDSGLEIEALNNAPGVATADWADTLEGRNYLQSMQRVWDELQAVEAKPPYHARFRAIICVCWPSGESAIFEGTVKGKIVWPPRGEAGFGYDPIFVPGQSNRTFAEMTLSEKSLHSHRSRALKSLAKCCLDAN